MARNYTLPAKKADKHRLYQWSVQDPELEVEFAIEQYKQRTGRSPRVLREDFCGTALVAARWVRSHPKRTAIGLDLDAETLEWAKQHNIKKLGKAAKRVELREQDVRTVTVPKADVVAAMNFSYYLLGTFAELVDYFKLVRESLAPGGIMILDCYGGWESQQTVKERRRVKGPKGTFGYVWEQAAFDPINNRALCHIHFEFKGGKRWKKAFTYDWRLFAPVEVHEALEAAGFVNIQVFWDVEEDEEASDYRPLHRAENSPGWVCYLVADGNAGSFNGNGHAK